MFNIAKRSTVALIALVINLVPAQAQSIDDAQAQIRSAWQSKIAQHRVSDPELAGLEEKMMEAQLRSDGQGYAKLTPAYLKMLAARHPQAAESLRQSAIQFEQAEQLRTQISEAVLNERTDDAKQKLRQLLDIERQRAFALSQSR